MLSGRQKMLPIQFRQYAAAVLEPVQPVREICFLDNSQVTVIEITSEGWLAASLPGMMPRRDDADRSRFLAGLLRDAIRRTFPEHDQPKFRACVLVYEHILRHQPSRRFIDHDNLELKHCQDVLEAAFLKSIRLHFALRFSAAIGENRTGPVSDPAAGTVPGMVEKLSGMLEKHHRKYVGIAKKIHTYFGRKPLADFFVLWNSQSVGGKDFLKKKRSGWD